MILFTISMTILSSQYSATCDWSVYKLQWLVSQLLDATHSYHHSCCSMSQFRTFHGNPREEAQRDAAGFFNWTLSWTHIARDLLWSFHILMTIKRNFCVISADLKSKWSELKCDSNHEPWASSAGIKLLQKKFSPAVQKPSEGAICKKSRKIMKTHNNSKRVT